MKRAIAAALVAACVTAAIAAEVCTFDVGSAHTLHAVNLCQGWTAWRTPSGDLLVTCPGQVPTVGSVELRDYYRISAPHR